MSKEFKTISEQAEILRGKGLAVTPEDENILLGENYYSVVNGYKEFFLDEEVSAAKGREIFRKGAAFGDIYDLFLFDRDLRQITMGYLIEAEARIRSVASYTFCEEHPEPNSYLDIGNYTNREEYMLGRKAWVSDLPRFIAKLESKAYTNRHCKGFIRHYRDHHENVPFWVLANDLTFGNLSYFFNLQRRSTQNQICRRIVGLRGPLPDARPLTPHSMRVKMRALVAFRNICAHDERLFCAKVGPVRDITFAHMYAALRDVLGEVAARRFAGQIVEAITRHPTSSAFLPRVIGGMMDVANVYMRPPENGTTAAWPKMPPARKVENPTGESRKTKPG